MQESQVLISRVLGLWEREDGIPVILLAGVTQPTLSLRIRTDSGRSGRLGVARPPNLGPAQSHIPISRLSRRYPVRHWHRGFPKTRIGIRR